MPELLYLTAFCNRLRVICEDIRELVIITPDALAEL